MSRQSEEQWEEAKVLALPPKQEAELNFTCLEQKIRSLKEFYLSAGFHPSGHLG